MLSVQIVLFDGFDLLDALAPYEVFCAAEMLTENALSVKLVTAEGPRSVPSGTNGLKIEAGDRLDPVRPGIILVPGASGPVEGDGPNSVPSILGRTVHTALPGMLGKALEQKEVVVATVCGGSLVLAMAGLLEGRPAVTNHLGMDLLGATGAVPIPARVVDDGNLVSGGGVTSGLDAALYLVEREFGPRIAHEIERLFEYERRGTVWRATGMAPIPMTGGEPQKAEKQAAIKVGPPTGKTQQEFAFDGEWDTTIATPIGKLQVRLSIVTYNGIVHGKAVQGNETVDFLDSVLQGDKLVWLLKITKPMRLNLKFEVAVDGDQMTGVAKAGMLPASKLTGRRIL
ncbi:DJ-1/PfpI family protein [Paenibacillus whitsoniae]|uniref:DJ-1/PfpI family protein n=1 Tax=Paenibacillus whitsoniae TaxID=2496558 RepID=A0A3S0A7F0_9BACL|nr:DJ-1/PfpI family protein [Paenibacillus whitsoniae]RTE11422.1 DJ-1/PfpI family protein [Paenibacillus whitsoniae]